MPESLRQKAEALRRAAAMEPDPDYPADPRIIAMMRKLADEMDAEADRLSAEPPAG